MIKPTAQLLEEAKEDLSEIIDYVAAETADVSLLLWLQDLELKFGTIYRRLSEPVVQQLPRNNDDYAFMAQSEDI
jgi:hypothetical protein